MLPLVSYGKQSIGIILVAIKIHVHGKEFLASRQPNVLKHGFRQLNPRVLFGGTGCSVCPVLSV